mmetsp:Transcript_3018/g.6097  ORF Transcript_3018/g.6097 Transcript_3018/m.6097 type:complete len:137 (-) Transcript_3018:280-690(-)|eukprot:CAMPEP_0182564406 /NCGR_PEP_ID=MMETSP1324-20130603/6343_1 /TAXON_ID=236786 /ORGANISM="Florenciella sp., Strain RCC1587" /LENGTH=136 /DNA_ID=CAMNT_0024777861 /DNA_START=210 /DNA_END=620 /DNA_ORIENTATION=+
MALNSKNLVKVIETEEAWDEWMGKSGDMLLVLDCHQDWCGQCETLQPTFLRIFMDNDEPESRLAFLSANIKVFKDKIKEILPEDSQISLDEHGCMPFFLLIRSNAVVANVIGANSPSILMNVQGNIPAKPEGDVEA